MGRNKKIGLDYFPFDVDFFSDIKIRKLIKYQRGKAVTVYALLLCLIYKNGYYMLWDEELPFIISEQTGFEEAYIQEVIKCCLALGLFSKELFEKEKVLTSAGIQERYKRICDDCRRKCEFSEFILISSEEKHISSEEKPINSAKSTQRKVNKIVERERIPPIIPNDETLRAIIKITEIKDLLLSENEFEWKEQMCRQSGLSVKFMDMLPEQIDNFLSWIQVIGEESSILTIEDAKRRFYYWWRDIGHKEWKLKNLMNNDGRGTKTFSRTTTNTDGKVICGEIKTGTDIQSGGTPQKDYSARF